MKRFYLDVGNTRAKWLLVDGEVERRGVVVLSSPTERVAKLIAIAPNVEFVGVSCVKGDEYIAKLAGSLIEAWGVEPVFAATREKQMGLNCAYKEPGRLGVDRWLAMLAAWVGSGQNSAVCVVDCGSAITIDLVSSEGAHLGGYILPGLRLGISGLLKGTDKVRVDFDKLPLATLDLGENTTDAVYHGALFSLNACVESSMNMLQNLQVGKECTLLLTGGDGGLLSKLTSQESVYNEDLVLQGLKLYFDNPC